VEFAPAALLVLVSGTLADRCDRRRLAAAGGLAQAVTAAGLAWYAATGPTSVGPIFVLIFLSGIARALAAPASRALPADIVVPGVPTEAEREAELRAEALLEAGVEMSEGAIVATAPAKGTLSEALEGLRFIRRQPELLGAISLDLFAVLFGGAVALLPAIAKD